jgi:hypothetical protein
MSALCRNVIGLEVPRGTSNLHVNGATCFGPLRAELAVAPEPARLSLVVPSSGLARAR